MKTLKKHVQNKYKTHKETLQKIPAFWNWRIILATWFGCGTFFPGPGFWGTLGALPLAIATLYAGGPIALLGVAIIIFVLGLLSIPYFEAKTKTHDSSIIVIDEAAGLMIAFTTVSLNSTSIALGFIFFRLFDVFKPFPVSWCDKKLPGKWGVMMDDIAAGIYAAIAVWICRYAGLG